jgi:hypothetical protein
MRARYPLLRSQSESHRRSPATIESWMRFAREYRTEAKTGGQFVFIMYAHMYVYG